MRGTRLLVVTLWMATGCRVVGNATPDGGTSVTIPQVEITNIALESPRPDSVGLNEDGGTVLEVYSGDIIQVEGRNWEVRDVTVTVGGVPLPVLEGSTNTLLRVKIPVAMPTGSVRVETTNSRGDSANSVVLLGPGHLEGLAERGLVQGQGIIHASGALLGCDLTRTTLEDEQGRTLSAACDPFLAPVFGVAVAFTPGLRASTQDTMYWAAISLDEGQSLDWFGPVPTQDTVAGFPLAGQQLMDLRAYGVELDAGVDRAPLLVHIPVALQLLYALQPGSDDPLVEARIITPFANTPPLDGVVGPLFVNQMDNGLLMEMEPSLPPRILSLRATPGSVTVLEHRPQPDGTLGVFPLDTNGQGGELLQRVAAAGQFDLRQLGRSVVASMDPPGVAPPNLPGFTLLTCAAEGDPANWPMELHPFALFDLSGNNGPAWAPLPAVPVQGCGQILCAGAVPEPALDGGLPPMPQQVPGLVPWGVGTVLVEPPVDRGVFGGNAGTPCVIFMDLDAGPPPDAADQPDASLDIDGGDIDAGEFVVPDPVEPDPAVCAVDAGPCGTGRPLWGLFGSALSVSHEQGSSAQYLHVLQDARNIVTAADVSPQTNADFVQQVISDTPYANLITDPLAGYLIGIPQVGAAVEVLSVANAWAAPAKRIPLNGVILGSWPLHGQGGGILVMHHHMGMVLDVGGNPTTLLPQPGRPLSGITRMEGGGANIFVVAGSTPLGPALFTWDTDAETPMLDLLFQEQDTYASLEPVAARDGHILYLRHNTPLGEMPPGSPGEPPVGGCSPELVRWSMGAPQPTVVPTPCNAEPSNVLLDRDANVWLATQNAENNPVLQVVRPGLPALDLSGVSTFSLALLPTGAVMAVAYAEGPPGRLTLACLTMRDNTLELVDVGPPPTLGGPILASPDGRRLFAGAVNGLLELEVPELEGNGCPPAATPQRPVPLPVTRRITLPGTPTSLSINRAGNRLIWMDKDAQLVGLVE